eukprot:g7524.t1
MSSKERVAYLGQLRKSIRNKLQAISAGGVTEIFVKLNRKGDGMLDVYEFAFGLQRIGLNINTGDLIDAFDLLNTLVPYYMSVKEFTQRVYSHRQSGDYEDSPAYNGDREQYEEEATPEQDPDSMHFRKLRRAAGREDGTYETLDGKVNVNDLLRAVIARLNSTHFKMKRMFNEMDADNSGKISSDQFAAGLEACGLRLSGGQVYTIFDLFDIGGDGQLSYSEFIKLLAFISRIDHREEQSSKPAPTPRPSVVSNVARRSHARRNRESASQSLGRTDVMGEADYELIKAISDAVYSTRKRVKKVFHRLDKDGSGSVSVTEAFNGFQKLGVQLTVQQVEALVDVFDENGDGGLRYSEFVRMLAESSKHI